MLPLPAGREARLGVGAPLYVHHRPERTLLYQIVDEYYPADSVAAGLYARGYLIALGLLVLFNLRLYDVLVLTLGLVTGALTGWKPRQLSSVAPRPNSLRRLDSYLRRSASIYSRRTLRAFTPRAGNESQCA